VWNWDSTGRRITARCNKVFLCELCVSVVKNKEVIMALLFIGVFIDANVGLIVASLILGAGVRDKEVRNVRDEI